MRDLNHLLPLRKGDDTRWAQMSLPADLTTEEAMRISRFVMALALPEVKK